MENTYPEWLQLVRKHVEAETRLTIRPLKGNEAGLRTLYCAGTAPTDISEAMIWNLACNTGHRVLASR